MKFKVIRKHGDFELGNIREGSEADLRHLIGKCLVPIEEKAARKVENKAVKAPNNKAK